VVLIEKKEGGMIGVDLGGTWGCHVRTRGIILGGKSFGEVNKFALAYLFHWYGGTMLVQLLRTILQST
jgi:hypothetical protein